MKKKEEILRDLFATLAELQGTAWTDKNTELKHYLQIKLSVLYNIFSEDVPEEYWEQIEKWTI